MLVHQALNFCGIWTVAQNSYLTRALWYLSSGCFLELWIRYTRPAALKPTLAPGTLWICCLWLMPVPLGFSNLNAGTCGEMLRGITAFTKRSSALQGSATHLQKPLLLLSSECSKRVFCVVYTYLYTLAMILAYCGIQLERAVLFLIHSLY